MRKNNKYYVNMNQPFSLFFQLNLPEENLWFQISKEMFICANLLFATNHLQLENQIIKFGYSKKATKFETKIFHLKFDVTYWVASNLTRRFFSNFVAFSEYPNFNKPSIPGIRRSLTFADGSQRRKYVPHQASFWIVIRTFWL